MGGSDSGGSYTVTGTPAQIKKANKQLAFVAELVESMDAARTRVGVDSCKSGGLWYVPVTLESPACTGSGAEVLASAVAALLRTADDWQSPS